ncbi:MAG: 3'-5' exonuclease [Bradymonadales bacterium]|nr:3'-5' exonuclease [Bradymonadales bacterium]
MSLPKSLKKIPIVAVDVETTGLDPERDRIIEVGLVEMVGGEVVGSYSQLVNPGIPIPRTVRELTGIRQEETESAPAFLEIAGQVLQRLEQRCIVGYNLSFDRAFLAAELARCGLSWPEGPQLDPLILARALLPWLKSKKLGDVAAELGVDLEEAHRAGSDAEAAGRILYAFSDRIPDDMDELLALQGEWERQREETLAIRRGRGVAAMESPFSQVEGMSSTAIGLGVGYAYGEEVDPYRALIRALPDVRTKSRDHSEP